MEKKPNKAAAKARHREDVKAIESGLGKDWNTDKPGFIPKNAPVKELKIPKETKVSENRTEPSEEKQPELEMEIQVEQRQSEAQEVEPVELEAVAEELSVDEPESAPFQEIAIDEPPVQQQPVNINDGESKEDQFYFQTFSDVVIPEGDRERLASLRSSFENVAADEEDIDKNTNDQPAIEDQEKDLKDEFSWDQSDFPVHPNNPFARAPLFEQQKVVESNPLEDVSRDTVAVSAEELSDSFSVTMEDFVEILEKMTECLAETRARLKNVESQLDRMGF